MYHCIVLTEEHFLLVQMCRQFSTYTSWIIKYVSSSNDFDAVLSVLLVFIVEWMNFLCCPVWFQIVLIVAYTTVIHIYLLNFFRIFRKKYTWCQRNELPNTTSIFSDLIIQRIFYFSLRSIKISLLINML